MSATPQFASSIVSAGVNIATANTNRDGTGVLGTLYTAPTSGARIDDIMIKAKGTTTAGMIRFFLHDGTNYRLLREIIVSAITPSGTTISFEQQLSDLAWCLASGWSIRVCTHNSESFDITITRGGAL